MTTYTENYSFTKPDDDDVYDVAAYGETLDKIDTILAEAEDTTAAILESLNTNSGEKYYTASETVRYSAGSHTCNSSYVNLKLMHFTAKHSGTVLFHLAYVSEPVNQNLKHTLSCYQSVDKQYIDLNNFGNTTKWDPTKASPAYQWNLALDLNDAKIILPVEKGQTYYFELYITSVSTTEISKAEICFDVISDSDITEFNAA